VLIPKGIKNNLSLSPRLDHVEIPEKPKLMGNGGFAYAQKDSEIPNAHFSLPQSEENAHSRGISQGAEHLSEFVSHLLGRSVFEGPLQTFLVNALRFPTGTRIFHWIATPFVTEIFI